MKTNTNILTKHEIFSHIFLKSYFTHRLEVACTHHLFRSLASFTEATTIIL